VQQKEPQTAAFWRLLVGLLIVEDSRDCLDDALFGQRNATGIMHRVIVALNSMVLSFHQTIVMERRFAGLHRLRVQLSFSLPWGHGSENLLEEESEQKRFRKMNRWIFVQSKLKNPNVESPLSKRRRILS
jgi:hypothetical protein